jgi:hypothetical protein
MVKKYIVNKNIMLQKLDGKLIGFDTDRSYIYTFNESAEYVFKKIKLGWDVEHIINGLLKKYDVTLAVLKKDVKLLIRDMIKSKIILVILPFQNTF